MSEYQAGKDAGDGLYRVNKNRKFNVPVGRYKNPSICDSRNLKNVSTVLRHSKAEIQNVDYRKMLLQAETNDFVYLDPPYDPVSSTSNFTAYTDHGFGDDDQLKLKKTFMELNHKNCKVLLSNSDTVSRYYSHSIFQVFFDRIYSPCKTKSKRNDRQG